MPFEAIDLSDSPVADLPVVDESQDGRSLRVGFNALSGRTEFKLDRKKQLLENFIALSPADVLDGHCLTTGQSLVLQANESSTGTPNFSLTQSWTFTISSLVPKPFDLQMVKNLEQSDRPP